MKILVWILRLAVAFVLISTVVMHKFRGTEETRYIFETIGMEPNGRYVIGTLELVAGLLILIPRTTGFGALLASGILAGAIFFHLTSLGIEVLGDGGALFYMAMGTFLGCIILLLLHRRQIQLFFRKTKPRG
ncbi:DoxX family protein [Niabella insulamsoli]|uniref:DoxX family protein n=1 Tax=Niabella insulamsoli TaxID=3144874 RepID=UPI0031FDB607